MRQNAFMALIFFAFVLTAPPAFAWQSETHARLAEKACRDFSCSCISEIRDAATIPDREFRDNINHHCYFQQPETLKGLEIRNDFHDNLSTSCAPSKYYDCPKKNDCPALEKMERWIAESKGKNGCEKWKDIGIASHYFFDSKVFWHKVQNEDYYKCHEPFEGKVEKRFEGGDGGNWTIEACGAKENYTNMVGYVNDFENLLQEDIGIKKIEDTPLLPECGVWCRIKAWLGF